MNSKNTRRITDEIPCFKLSSLTIKKELSEWKSNRSGLDLLIFFIKRLAAYKATLLGLEHSIGELFDMDLSKATERSANQEM